MTKCNVCGKDAEGKIFEKGKFFCCKNCLEQYKNEAKNDTKPNVCEFC